MRWPTKSLPELRASKGVTHVSLLSFQEAKFFPKTRESLRGLVSSLVDGFLGSLGNLVHGFLPCFCGLIHHLLNRCSGRCHWNRDVGFSSSDTTNHRGSTCQPHLFSRVDCPTCPRMDAIKVKSFDQGYSVSEGHEPFP